MIIVLIIAFVISIVGIILSERTRYIHAMNQFQLYTPRAGEMRNRDYNFFAISYQKGIVWIKDSNHAFFSPDVEPAKFPDKYYLCSDEEKEMLQIINRWNKKVILSIIKKQVIYI
jgi:hypothetical protein